MIAVGVVAAADGAYLAVLVLYVTQVLHRGSTAYGLLLAFGAVGGIVAGASCALLTRWIGAPRLLTATVVVMAGTQLALGLTSDLAVSAVALLCSSGAFAVFNATSRSMRQRHTPPHLLGRVNSTYLTVGRGAGALGALMRRLTGRRDRRPSADTRRSPPARGRGPHPPARPSRRRLAHRHDVTSTRTLPTVPRSTARCASAVRSSGKRTSGRPCSSPTDRAPSRTAAATSSAAAARTAEPAV